MRCFLAHAYLQNFKSQQAAAQALGSISAHVNHRHAPLSTLQLRHIACNWCVQAAPADLHRLVLNVTITATHLLRLWANRPAVLQGSSAAAKVTTAVVLDYIGFPWKGDVRAKVRRQAFTPGEQ
jgi:hypothetical protein